MVTYSESGVDIDLEALTVSKLASKLQPTLEYRNIITDSGHFAALVELGDKAIAMSTDGVGSKILVAKMMEKYDTVGIDMIAMVVNDILCVGAEPIESQIAIIGGETASLPGIVKDFDLAGTGIGFVDKDKIITGVDIQEGDILIGLRSSGIHSNGLSLARRAIFEEGGFDVNDKMPNGETTIGEEMLKPTQLYVKAIVELLKHDFNIKGLAHMTGGGVNNLSRLKKGIGFDITDYPEPQDIFKLIYQQGVPLEEMYKVFNMGVGFCVIASPEEADAVVDALNENIEAQIVGTVTAEEKITVKTFEGTVIEY